MTFSERVLRVVWSSEFTQVGKIYYLLKVASGFRRWRGSVHNHVKPSKAAEQSQMREEPNPRDLKIFQSMTQNRAPSNSKEFEFPKIRIYCWIFAIVKTRYHSQSFSLRPMWLIYRIAEQGCLVDAFNSGYWFPINGTWKRLSIDGLTTPEAPGNFCAS